jgi:hypothetical protein
MLMIGILLAWDFTKPRHKQVRVPEVATPQGPNGGFPPWNANETGFRYVRDSVRKSTLSSLDQPWSTFCQPEGRKRLASSLKEYFWQRGGQENSYPARWGGVGRAYIAREWSTADDQRIERLVEELYWRGYLDLRSLDRLTAEMIIPLVKNTRVMTQPCRA